MLQMGEERAVWGALVQRRTVSAVRVPETVSAARLRNDIVPAACLAAPILETLLNQLHIVAVEECPAGASSTMVIGVPRKLDLGRSSRIHDVTKTV